MMGDMQSIGGAIHNEEMKAEAYFVSHPVALAVGVAVAVALMTIAVLVFFKI